MRLWLVINQQLPNDMQYKSATQGTIIRVNVAGNLKTSSETFLYPICNEIAPCCIFTQTIQLCKNSFLPFLLFLAFLQL